MVAIKFEQMFHNESGPPVKRKRTVTSCAQCRKKKVKCDKGRPQCKVCLQSNKGEACEYQEPSWGEHVQSTNDYTLAANVPMAHISLPQSGGTGTSISSQSPSINTQRHSSEAVFQLNQPSTASNTRSSSTSSVAYSNLSQHRQSLSHQQPTQLPLITPQAHQQPQSIPLQLPLPQTPPGFTFPSASGDSLIAQQRFMHGTYPQPVHDGDFRTRQKVDYNESNLRGRSSLAPGSISDSPASSITVRPFMIPQASDDTMTFYDDSEPVVVRAGRLVASGPLSLASIVKKDPFLRVTLLKIRKEKNEFAHPFQNRSVDSKELLRQILVDKGPKSNSKVEEAFSQRLLQNEALDAVKGNKTERRDTHAFGSQKVDYETETIMKIEEVLPRQDVIWKLYDMFIQGPLFGFMPFINEPFLTEKIQLMIGKRTDEAKKVPGIVISSRFDFAYIGILLIILRLSYLSISKTSTNTEMEKFILAHPIGTNVINVAQMCINQFRIFRRGAIPLLQCSLFMRYYHKLSPEDGDGSDGGDSEVFLGVLLQMGNSIGLNRDLGSVHRLKDHKRLVHVWKFLWHEIVSLDLFISVTRGSPILVDENSFNTQVPSWSDDYLQAGNPEVYRSAIKNFQMSDDINELVRPILRDILNMKKPVKIGELSQKLYKLEEYIAIEFKSTDHILNLPTSTVNESIDKIYRMKNYIELRTSLFAIYYHIYLNNPTANFHLLIKMISTSMELVPLTYFLITINNGKTNYFDLIFGSGAQLILVPTILTSMHKIAQLLISFISRTLDVKYNYPNHDKYLMSLIVTINTGFMESFSIVRDSFQSLSSVYYHAWKNYKGFDFLFKLLTCEKNNIWDKNSKMNKEMIDNEAEIPPELNHLRAIPSQNFLTMMNAQQLEEMRDLVTTKRFEEPVLRRLHTRSKKTTVPLPNSLVNHNILNNIDQQASHVQMGSSAMSDQMNMSDQSTPPLNGYHVNQNINMTSSEIDRQWFEMMAQNTNSNSHAQQIEQLLYNQGPNVGLSLSNAGGSDALDVDNEPLNSPIDSHIPMSGMNNGAVQGAGTNGTTGTGVDPTNNNFGGVFGMLDLEKFALDSSPYDTFEMPAFYQDTSFFQDG